MIPSSPHDDPNALPPDISLASPAEIGALVRRVRKAYGLTQGELAGSSGVGLRFVVDLERGKPTCEVGKVLHVMQMLGIRLFAQPPVT